MNDSANFYKQLAQYADIIIPQLKESIRLDHIGKFVDVRIIPYLTDYMNTGTDSLLASLCWLAGRVEDPLIDPVLASLFQRWHRRFDLRSKRIQYDWDSPLWRALASLRTHPRFQYIPNYDLRLMELLDVPVSSFCKSTIVRILMSAPRSYTRLESLLFRASPLEHFFDDEVDCLDAAADVLFNTLHQD